MSEVHKTFKACAKPSATPRLTDERKKATKHLVDQRSDETPQLIPNTPI
jgi:hypothetical protein